MATAGLVLERLDRGDSDRGPWISGAIMVSLVVLLVSAEVLRSKDARRIDETIGPHLLGAVLPVLLAHAGLAIAVHVANGAILVEGPRQLVNDAVLVLGLLGLVRCAAARDMRERTFWLLTASALVASYAHTAEQWHLDRFEGIAVQRYVIAQVTAGAFGLFSLLAIRFAGRSSS